MDYDNLKNEFQAVKEFYACGKCQTQDISTPILLKTCRHIFCTHCIIIRDKQLCPKCQEMYSSKDVDRGNELITNILKNIQELSTIIKLDQFNGNEDGESLLAQPIELSDQSLNKLSGITNTSSTGTNENIIETTVEVHVEDSQAVLKQKKRISSGNKKHTTVVDVHIAARESTPDVVLNKTVDSVYTDPAITQVAAEYEIEESFKHVMLSKTYIKRNPKGETPLHVACKRGNVNHVKFLLEGENDVNCVDWANWSPLHEAVQVGSYDCCHLLLKAGCLVNIPAQNYTTPLHQATEMKMKDICELLVAHGGDMNAVDLYGKTPRDYCDDEFLLNHLTNVKVIDEDVDTKRRLVFNCDSSQSDPKESQSMEASLLKKVTVSEGFEYLALPNSFEDYNKETRLTLARLFKPTFIMAALIKAIPIIYEKDVPSLLNSTNMAFLQLIPHPFRCAYKRSLLNRLHRRPKLFDGMQIHLPPNIRKYIVNNVQYNREDLQALIEIAGGTLLKRAPSESTVEGISHCPYHYQSSNHFKHCSHFIIYDHEAPPLLLYNMQELRHVSAHWLLKCIWHFKILCDYSRSQP